MSSCFIECRSTRATNRMPLSNARHVMRAALLEEGLNTYVFSLDILPNG